MNTKLICIIRKVFKNIFILIGIVTVLYFSLLFICNLIMHDEDTIIKEVVAPNEVDKAVAFLRRGYDWTTLNVSILKKDMKTSDDNYGDFGNTFSIFVNEHENYNLDYFELKWVSDNKLRIQYKKSSEGSLTIKVVHRYGNDIEYIVK